ncbi:Sugar-specific transcriptional regulator TrmB [Halorubrum aquaticum]|uniref:Sugar-specific transcriptional regulator TrmB n=1 Tax=Halorubrum aquaticum TaxID=387340 RepID=A0A1I3ADR7_9EURY|nr:helix-turn-helix domain-containing protein [Halorubrum aquaticum]SFH48095.1 Sugar-specific transcriptional regulator TrmB [Halorubrum aquaticum]
MNDLSNHERAIELLQELGLKEYEAKAFVALTRLPQGTAKEISEISEVPRTRVYDAVRVLETKGLVEIQHASPQRFRAVSIDEAAETLRREYEERADSLRTTLREVEPAIPTEETEVTHEVWALSGASGITSRTQQLVDESDREVILVIGDESAYTPELRERLRAAEDRGVSVVIGITEESLRERVERDLPDAKVFVSGLEWLSSSVETGDETVIGRLLLVDRNTILVSSFHEAVGDGHDHEQAVFGRGFDNGLVAIVRRLMSTGLLSNVDP